MHKFVYVKPEGGEFDHEEVCQVGDFDSTFKIPVPLGITLIYAFSPLNDAYLLPTSLDLKLFFCYGLNSLKAQEL